MKTKKILSLLLAGILALSVSACGQQEAVTNNQDSSSSTTSVAEDGSSESSLSSDAEAGNTSDRPTEPSGQLVMGVITPVENDFYDASFNNNATNYSMYGLIHGGSTVVYTKEGQFEFDSTLVANHEETENEDGSKTYTVTINDGLVWSDGTPITAKDFVFQALLENSKQITGVDGYPANGLSVVKGYNEYVSGETDCFSGIHLVDDMTYSVTIAAEELPNHYDIIYASLAPRPMAVLAPGCDVEDTENGAHITGDFTTEMLVETINNPDTGYRYHPEVTFGPYLLKSYDTASRQATLEVNPNYPGDYRGVKPVIKTLILKTVSSDTMMNELESGSVDMLFQCSGADTVNSGLDLVEAGKVQDHTYFRNGYGKLQFDCSQFPTDSEKVRQAIAYCLDRNEFARQYSGGYAAVVQAAYGLAQWEYQESTDWINENLNTYEMNIETAKQLLDEDGWNLNADGTPYSGTGTRYKDVNGELKPLVIEWANSEGNPVSELLATMLPETMAEAGMELSPTTMDVSTLFACISHSGDKIYNMYNLATGFSTANSPWYTYSMDERFMTAGYNSNWISDQELADAAGAMETIPYEDNDAWLEAWRNYIKVWNEKLPDIPLYSDEYYDFYSLKVQGWDANSMWDWSSAILDAWVTE